MWEGGVMLQRRHNQQLFTWLLQSICGSGGGWRVRGEVDAASGAVTFDRRSMLGPSGTKKFRRGVRRRALRRGRGGR
jgi:hypothetical protein